MKIEYDSEVDVLMIYLREGEYAGSEEIANMIVDFDEEGNPLTIEILNARQVLGTGENMLQVEVPVILSRTA
jgi:uncharacterized protein YuzE